MVCEGLEEIILNEVSLGGSTTISATLPPGSCPKCFYVQIYRTCNTINVKYKENRVGETVWVIDRFSLCLMDIGGIPRNHLRLVRISFLIENLNHVKGKFVKSRVTETIKMEIINTKTETK